MPANPHLPSLYLQPSFRCSVCHQDKDIEELYNPNMSIMKPLAVDHHHGTGIRRELLCATCNLLLGQVEKDPERFQAILLSIKKHQ